jgi:hypothetical protein
MRQTPWLLVVSCLIGACAQSAPTPEAPPAAPVASSAPPTAAPSGETAPANPQGYPTPSGPAGQIVVLAATYGPNCGVAHGNVTQQLAAACNGKPSCDYKVDYQIIGDPAVGCVKTFVAEWHCGAGSQVQSQTLPGEAGYGEIATLRCAR